MQKRSMHHFCHADAKSRLNPSRLWSLKQARIRKLNVDLLPQHQKNSHTTLTFATKATIPYHKVSFKKQKPKKNMFTWCLSLQQFQFHFKHVEIEKPMSFEFLAVIKSQCWQRLGTFCDVHLWLS